MKDAVYWSLGLLGLALCSTAASGEDIEFRTGPSDGFVIMDHGGADKHLQILDSGAVLLPGLPNSPEQDPAAICFDQTTGRLGSCSPGTLAGTPGAQGPAGAQGPPGNPGPDGQAGPTGPRGPSNLNGYQWVRESFSVSLRANQCVLQAKACPTGKRVLSTWTNSSYRQVMAVRQFPITDTSTPVNSIGMWVDFCNRCRVGMHVDCSPNISNPAEVEVHMICVEISG